MATFFNNGRTSGYTISGSGTPVLLFHGTTQSSDAWNQVISSSSEPRTWVCFELPGSGESAMPLGPIELDDVVDDAVALMKHLGHEEFHVAGYSLGAVVALRCAGLYTNEVQTLTSLCGWARSDARMKQTFELWRRLLAISHEIFMRYALVDGYTVATLEMLEPMLDQVISLGSGAIQPGSDAHLELDIRIDIEESLSKIIAPCLVLGATHDRWVDISHSHHIAQQVSGATLVELPAGHLVIGEMPQVIAQLLIAHTS